MPDFSPIQWVALDGDATVAFLLQAVTLLPSAGRSPGARNAPSSVVAYARNEGAYTPEITSGAIAAASVLGSAAGARIAAAMAPKSEKADNVVTFWA